MISPSARTAIGGVLMSMWAGAGIFFSAAVARAAFAVLPSRALAGALVGRLLPAIFISGILVAIGAFVLGGSSRLSRSAAATVAIMCAIAQFVVAPRIAALRDRIGPSLDALTPTDPLRQSFGQLHAVSVALLGVALLSALVFLFSTYRSFAALRA